MSAAASRNISFIIEEATSGKAVADRLLCLGEAYTVKVIWCGAATALPS
jgi:hypothetical protein